MKRPLFLSQSGVYIIICLANLRFYVGSSKRLTRRFSEHVSDLKMGIHSSYLLQRSWNKYGPDQFMFGVLEYCPETDRVTREQTYLDRFRSYVHSIGFNISDDARSSGGVMSEATRDKIRQSRLGKKTSPETIAKNKAAWVENYDRWQQQSIDTRGVVFQIVSPSGETHEVKGLKRFARLHGLDRCQLARVVKGVNQSVRGWHLPDITPIVYRVIDPEGHAHSIKQGTLTAFCQERGLNVVCLNRLAIGTYEHPSYRGWTRVEA